MQAAGETVKDPALSPEYVFTGDLAAMAAARDRIMDLVREHCANESDEIDIMIALQEGLANAVLHGCQNDPGKTVRCSIEVTPEAISIVIRDPGPGFDTEAISTDAAGNLTEHGRGIHLMRSLMDEVSYGRGGSELRLKKKRIPQA